MHWLVSLIIDYGARYAATLTFNDPGANTFLSAHRLGGRCAADHPIQCLFQVSPSTPPFSGCGTKGTDRIAQHALIDLGTFCVHSFPSGPGLAGQWHRLLAVLFTASSPFYHHVCLSLTLTNVASNI